MKTFISMPLPRWLSAAIALLVVMPASASMIRAQKEVDPPTPNTYHVGDTITYTLTIVNPANNTVTNTMTNIVDTLPNGSTVQLNAGAVVLVPGASKVYTYPYVVTSNDVQTAGCENNKVAVNKLDISGFDGNCDSVRAFVEKKSLIIKPVIHIEKTADPTLIHAGNLVTYTYLVTNPGDVPLGNVTVTDNQGVTPAYVSGDVNLNGKLDLTETWTYTATAHPQASVTNIGTACGKDMLGMTVCDTDDAVVQVINPSILVIKTAVPTLIHAGDLVTYTYAVTNTGNVPLHAVTLDDNVPGVMPMYISGDLNNNGLLDLTELWIYRATATPQNTVTNIATVCGIDMLDQTVCDDDDAVVTVVKPGILIVKTASPSTIHAGDLVTYTFAVTNTGNVALTNVVVTDVLPGITPVYVSGDANNNKLLDLTELWIYTATNHPQSTVTNVATVCGKDMLGTTVCDDDNEIVTVIHPGVLIVKTAAPTLTHAGDLVTYTYVVTNTGDTALTNVVVTDDQTGVTPVYVSGDANNNKLLDLTELWIYTSSAHPSNTVTNVGTVCGKDMLGRTVCDDDDAVVTVIHPAVVIVKTAVPTLTHAGDLVNYTYVVTNAGDVALTNVVVTDDQTGVTPVYVSGDANNNKLLDLTEIWVFSSSAHPSNTVTNVGTVCGKDMLGRTVCDDDDAVVTVLHPAVLIIKTAVPLLTHAGDLVTYTYVVTNTGDTALTNVVVTDDQTGVTPVYVSGDANNNKLLDLTELWVFTSSAHPSNTVTNVGTVCGQDMLGKTVCDDDDAVVTVIHPAIHLEKSVDQPVIQLGESVTYTYEVTNTGDTPLHNLILTDNRIPGVIAGPLSGDTNADGWLDLTEMWTYTATHAPPIVGVYTNIGNVCGKDMLGTTVCDDDDAEVRVLQLPPGLRLLKSVSPTNAAPGTMVTYSYVVTNTGGFALSGIVVRDDNGTPNYTNDDFIVGTVPSLAPGAAATLTAGVIPPIKTVTVITNNTINAGIIIIVSTLGNGDVKITYLQDFGINDNTYGTGAIGWGTKGHTFGNLTGSDKLEFRVTDGNGNTAIDFYLDCISQAAGVTVPGTGQTIVYPSGYGTMGPFGGDGSMVSGDPNNIVTFSTSISENLNIPANLPFKAGLIVNSPTSLLNPSAPPSDTNVLVNLAQAPGGWNHINTYSVVLKAATFGNAGFGSVSVPDQHNSPSKLGVNQITTTPVPYCVTNVAVAATVFVSGGSSVTLSSTSTAVVCLGPEPLPSPWQTKDVGSVTAAGSAFWDSGTSAFTLLGDGSDIGGSADAFRFVYQSANGDCRVVARVASVQKTDNNAKAAVMIRDSLNANAMEASMAVTPAAGLAFSTRATTGGSTVKVTKTGLVAPYWVAIERVGNTFTASYSPNGSSWTALGTKTIGMGPAPYIGLGVTSHKGGTLCTAVFDNITATP